MSPSRRRAGELGKPAVCPSRSPGAGAGLCPLPRWPPERHAPCGPGDVRARTGPSLSPRLSTGQTLCRCLSGGPGGQHGLSLSADAPQLPTLPPSEVGAASRATLGGVELRCAPGQRLRRRAREQPRLPIRLTSDRDRSWWLSGSGVLGNSGSASVLGRAPFNEPRRSGTARCVRSAFAGGPEALSTQRMDS